MLPLAPRAFDLDGQKSTLTARLACKRVANIQDMTRGHRAAPDKTKRPADLDRMAPEVSRSNRQHDRPRTSKPVCGRKLAGGFDSRPPPPPAETHCCRGSCAPDPGCQAGLD